MSAFVVDKVHIDAMIQKGLHRQFINHGALRWMPRFDVWGAHSNELTRETQNAVGQMLVDECVKSVSYRYPGSNGDLPGPCKQYWKEPYRFKPMCNAPSPIQTIKLIECYEYQTCEHPDWKTSQARSFCAALKEDMISRIEGYDEAKWEFIL